jgi:hypothetical protein
MDGVYCILISHLPRRIFLYLFLVACFAGTCYFIYKNLIAPTLFPKQKSVRGGQYARTPSKGSSKVAVADSSVDGADGPANATGARAVDHSWIDAQHLKRPGAKRVGSGRSGVGKPRVK